MENHSTGDNSYDACWLCLAASQEKIRATLFRSVLGKRYTEAAGKMEAEKCQMTKKQQDAEESVVD